MGWFPYSFDDSLVSRVPAHDGVNRGSAFTHSEVRVRYRNKYDTEGMQLDFAKLAVRRSKDASSNEHGTFSIANQRAFETLEVAEVAKVSPSGGGLVHEVPGDTIELDVIIEDEGEDCDLLNIMTDEVVEAIALRHKMRAQQKKCRLTRVEVAAEMLAVVELAE